MVRKRSRRYDSDENDSDSDVDFDFEQKSKSGAKKYSLRERKKTFFTTADFDYYGLDDDDEEGKKPSSDDEDFEVDADPADTNGARAYFEPDPEAVPENPEGLIDFEDIIRADIVVNKNKIDYDNIIQKTEIKLTAQGKKRRGRPPKNRSDDSIKEEENETNIECQPDLDPTLDDNKEEIENNLEEKKENEENAQQNIEEKKEESLPNGAVIESSKNSQDKEPLVTNDDPLELQTAVTQPPPNEKSYVYDDDDDDDVIVLEPEQPVIVLDD